MPVVCEADIADFQDINSALVAAGFDLGWFYPVYVSRTFEEWRPQAFRDEGQNDAGAPRTGQPRPRTMTELVGRRVVAR